MFDIPDFETVHELDFDDEVGSLMGWHLRGHGHDPDVIDRFLAIEGREALDWDEERPREWEVTEVWVRKVPIPSTGGYRYAYCNGGRGASPVTAVMEPSWWEYWCLNHPDERASIGVPSVRVVDGEAIVTRRLAELADEIDPRRDVDSRMGTIYLCPECAARFYEREREARAAAQRGVA